MSLSSLSGEAVLAEVDHVSLVDNPVDGVGEEWAWVPCDFAATPEAAIELLAAEVPLEDEDFVYHCQGQRSWHRPQAVAIRRDAGWFFVAAEDGFEEYQGCKGAWTEYCPWQRCQPDEVGAVEFWDIEVTDREHALLAG